MMHYKENISKIYRNLFLRSAMKQKTTSNVFYKSILPQYYLHYSYAAKFNAYNMRLYKLLNHASFVKKHEILVYFFK